MKTTWLTLIFFAFSWASFAQSNAEEIEDLGWHLELIPFEKGSEEEESLQMFFEILCKGVLEDSSAPWKPSQGQALNAPYCKKMLGDSDILSFPMEQILGIYTNTINDLDKEAYEKLLRAMQVLFSSATDNLYPQNPALVWDLIGQIFGDLQDLRAEEFAEQRVESESRGKTILWYAGGGLVATASGFQLFKISRRLIFKHVLPNRAVIAAAIKKRFGGLRRLHERARKFIEQFLFQKKIITVNYESTTKGMVGSTKLQIKRRFPWVPWPKRYRNKTNLIAPSSGTTSSAAAKQVTPSTDTRIVLWQDPALTQKASKGFLLSLVEGLLKVGAWTGAKGKSLGGKVLKSEFPHTWKGYTGVSVMGALGGGGGVFFEWIGPGQRDEPLALLEIARRETVQKLSLEMEQRADIYKNLAEQVSDFSLEGNLVEAIQVEFLENKIESTPELIAKERKARVILLYDEVSKFLSLSSDRPEAAPPFQASYYSKLFAALTQKEQLLEQSQQEDFLESQKLFVDGNDEADLRFAMLYDVDHAKSLQREAVESAKTLLNGLAPLATSYQEELQDNAPEASPETDEEEKGLIEILEESLLDDPLSPSPEAASESGENP